MDLTQFNAGDYEEQYQHRSFLPTKIHHKWVVSDPKIQMLLSRADYAVGELNAFAQIMPDGMFFISMYVAKEATQSSKIEGTQTNIEDAFKEADDLSLEASNDWDEVKNYIAAINYAINRLENLPLSNRLLKETHGILMQGVRGEHKQPGTFRTSQNWIGRSLKNAVFVPPNASRVPDLMGDMESFLHDARSLPPLLKIGIAHYQFETIHPFLDGNGRLGRLMIPLYLASERLLSKPALYLSDYFLRHKTAYIDCLMAVRQGHHLQQWLVFFLDGVEETARSAIAVFKQILQIKTRIDQQVLPRFSGRRQANAQGLIKHLYGHPLIDIKGVMRLLKITHNTANSLVADFIKHGVLVETAGRQRNRLYVFNEYIALFRDNDNEDI